MTTDPVDDSEDVYLPAVEADAVSTGAAADSADPYEHLKGLPRLLRFAMMISHNARPIKYRLIAYEARRYRRCCSREARVIAGADRGVPFRAEATVRVDRGRPPGPVPAAPLRKLRFAATIPRL
jgi:hypothetical protein